MVALAAPGASAQIARPIAVASNVQAVSSWSSASTGLISDSRLDRLRSRVANKTEPTYSAWLKVRQSADAALSRQPHTPSNGTWYVPLYYVDSSGHAAAKEGLRDDANSAYMLALAYRITGQERYAVSAARLVSGWAMGMTGYSLLDDSKLAFSLHANALIFAADLIETSASFPVAAQKRFKTFLRTKALPLSTMDRANNWGNWGVLLEVSCAAYLGDKVLFDRAVARWKYLIGSQISSNGTMFMEVTRDEGRRGIWYSNFALMPQTIAAEVMRVRGTEVFNFRSSNGRSLQLAFERLAPWVEDPSTFPYATSQTENSYYASYFELLNRRWPNSAATAVIARSRPMSATHSAPALTFTHGNLW